MVGTLDSNKRMNFFVAVIVSVLLTHANYVFCPLIICFDCRQIAYGHAKIREEN